MIKMKIHNFSFITVMTFKWTTSFVLLCGITFFLLFYDNSNLALVLFCFVFVRQILSNNCEISFDFSADMNIPILTALAAFTALTVLGLAFTARRRMLK